ncbi:hypothetical protein BpHYR1_029772 [Brachionus plicatilis]|uniref:Uncharacterized protein n=1 Tax=Brachionus plicatilis TaxID=10195 RepID=A0A3M7T9G3_BRAPC|nr:hypothetical protein BpHYR1_029772 [Brachionus plicatilis]
MLRKIVEYPKIWHCLCSNLISTETLQSAGFRFHLEYFEISHSYLVCVNVIVVIYQIPNKSKKIITKILMKSKKCAKKYVVMNSHRIFLGIVKKVQLKFLFNLTKKKNEIIRTNSNKILKSTKNAMKTNLGLWYQ